MTPYLRGLVSWVGFKQVSIFYDREERAAGETKFPLFKHIFRDFATLRGPIGTMVIGLTSFSLSPIVLILLTGCLLCVGTVIALFTQMLSRLLNKQSPPPETHLVHAIFLLSGIQLLSQGILGIYLGRVYQDVKGRPRYIIASTFGFSEAQ